MGLHDNMMYYSGIGYLGTNYVQQTQPINKIYWLSVVMPNDYPHAKFHGIQILIEVAHSNKTASEDFYKEFNGNSIFYLMGHDDVKIPVRYECYNGYNENTGTSRIFGYIELETVAPDSMFTPKDDFVWKTLKL